MQAGGANLSAWEIFVLGALAKSLTTVVTYPLQVAQSLMRVQSAAAVKPTTTSSSTGAQEDEKSGVASPPPQHQQQQSLVGCLAQIYREQGVTGYFAGLEAKLLQTVLTAAISLVTYEKLFALILALMRQPQPRALEKAAA